MHILTLIAENDDIRNAIQDAEHDLAWANTWNEAMRDPKFVANQIQIMSLCIAPAKVLARLRQIGELI